MHRCPAQQAYLDGELCGIRPDGTTSFSLIQNASDSGNGDALVFFLFDLLHLDGETIGTRPLAERKERLRELLSHTSVPLQFSDHQVGRGRAIYDHACALTLEGIVSKRADAPYAPGNRGHCTSFSIPIAICRRRIPRGTRFTANAFASTAASDVPAVRSFTSRWMAARVASLNKPNF